ncbi:cytoplasmic tRNA 2-thiolation protein 2 [Eurosta solidaginis]|uniref:cytoplasmic tRNA 2-thiolation protein 2 n=1 Tax=Eurosta solidaginis TaxID=178769 RepID=UPI0035316002
MCSIKDGMFLHKTPQEQVDIKYSEEICQKCQQVGEIYKLHHRMAECKSCYQIYVSHKFRATLASSKALGQGGNVMLIFDSTPESIVLLDLMRIAQSKTNFKRLNCVQYILFIDVYDLCNEAFNSDEYSYYIQNGLKVISYFKVAKRYVVNVRNVKNPIPFDVNDIEQYFARDRFEEISFSKSCNGIRTVTSRNEFVKLHYHNLIASVGTYLNCKYIFLPTVNNSLAVDMLSAIVLGRGNNAALDVACEDDRLGNGLKVIRPLKGLSKPEIELYILATNLKLLNTTNNWKSKGLTSLQSLTELFVGNLQKQYPATVHTIIRTGNKIATSSYIEDREKIRGDLNIGLCSLCRSPFLLTASNTILAVDYSLYVSAEGSMNSLENFIAHLDTNRKKQSICYSCEYIKRDCN